MLEKLFSGKERPTVKGNLGEISVIKDLVKNGLEVFKQMGNDSKVDLIVLTKKYKCLKIQVKATQVRNGVATLELRKKCLNKKYDSIYHENEIDIFALYVIDIDKVFYISSKEALKNKTAFSIRIDKPGKPNKRVKNIDEYCVNKVFTDLTDLIS